MVGQNIGAGKYDRVKEVLKVITLINLVVFTILTVIVLAAPRAVFSLFTTDESVLSIVGLYVPAAVLDFYGAATRAPAFSLINGSGLSKLNLTVALLDGIVGRIGFGYLLGFTFHYGCKGIWIGQSLCGFLPIVIGIIFYISGKWKTREHVLRKD